MIYLVLLSSVCCIQTANIRLRIVCWLMYLFVKLLMMRSSNIYYVGTFYGSFRQAAANRFS